MAFSQGVWCIADVLHANIESKNVIHREVYEQIARARELRARASASVLRSHMLILRSRLMLAEKELARRASTPEAAGDETQITRTAKFAG